MYVLTLIDMYIFYSVCFYVLIILLHLITALEVQKFSNNDIVFPNYTQNVDDEQDGEWVKQTNSQIKLHAESLPGEIFSIKLTQLNIFGIF